MAGLDCSQLNWRCKAFADLSAAEIYAALALRARVFVQEQRCTFTDPDGQDEMAWHVFGESAQGELYAYARFFTPSTETLPAMAPSSARGVGVASIGRVVTSPQVRRKGLGRPLMYFALEQLYARTGPVTVQIGAQSRLLGFYQSLGFERCGSAFLEDGILHQYMQMQLSRMLLESFQSGAAAAPGARGAAAMPMEQGAD